MGCCTGHREPLCPDSTQHVGSWRQTKVSPLHGGRPRFPPPPPLPGGRLRFPPTWRQTKVSPVPGGRPSFLASCLGWGIFICTPKTTVSVKLGNSLTLLLPPAQGEFGSDGRKVSLKGWVCPAMLLRRNGLGLTSPFLSSPGSPRPSWQEWN